jgi:hypothetical protein
MEATAAADGGLTKLFLEVKGSSIVHGELDFEAGCALDEKQPGVDVEGSVTAAAETSAMVPCFFM